MAPEDAAIFLPLKGMRVADLSLVVSGPMATQILADQGADVIKIEPLPKTTVDVVRLIGPRSNGVSALHAVINRNKRSLCLDLKAPAGRDVLLALLRTVDVVINNFRPGAMDRLGLSYEEVLAVNPRIIYLTITGFGSNGPLAGMPVYDPLVQAAAGYADVQSGGTGSPSLVRQYVADKVTALTVAQAISAAYASTERPRCMEISMLDAAVAFLWPEVLWNQVFPPSAGVPPQLSLAGVNRVYGTRDGQHVVLLPVSDRDWNAACAVLRRDSLASDPRFLSVADRYAHLHELAATLREAIAEWPAEQLCQAMTNRGVPCALVCKAEGVPTDPQLHANAAIVETVHPDAGRVRMPAPPVWFGPTVTPPALAIRHHAPRIGEHTTDVLHELGLPAERIAAMVAEGVVHTAKTAKL